MLVSRVVSSLRSLIAVARRRRRRLLCISRKGYAWRVSTSHARSRPAALEDERLRSLLEAPEELAKRWLLTLLAARPLRDADEVSLRLFAAHAPAVCGQVLAALGSDAELERLRSSETLDDTERGPRVAALVGAHDAPAVVEALEALRAALWGSLRDALPDLDGAAAGALADRLAHACSLLTAAQLDGVELAVADPAVAERAPAAHAEAESPAEGEPDGADRAPHIELQDAGGAQEGEAIEDPWAIEPPASPTEPAWPQSVASEIERQPDPEAPFVVLLIEVVGLDRLRHAEEPQTLEELMAEVHRVLREPLGVNERLAAEGTGRWWLVASDAGAAEGRALAQRLARGVRTSVAHRRVPLKVAIGVATAPEDGLEAAELAERAEEELYAACASGVCVLPATAASAPAQAPGISEP